MKTEDLLFKLARTRGEGPELETSCPTREELAAFRDSTCTDEAREPIERHLSQCGACVDLLLSLGKPEPRLTPRTVGRILAATEPERVERRRPVPQWAAGAMAAAAAIMLVVVSQRGSVDPVPPYLLTPAGQVMDARGAETVTHGTPVYVPESDVVLRATPAQGQPSELPGAVVFVETRDGSWERLEPAPTVETDASSGLVELRFRAGAVFGDRYGRYRVMVLLLPSGLEPPERLPAGGAPIDGATPLIQVLDYRPG